MGGVVVKDEVGFMSIAIRVNLRMVPEPRCSSSSVPLRVCGGVEVKEELGGGRWPFLSIGTIPLFIIIGAPAGGGKAKG